jgi:hypothetical protein
MIWQERLTATCHTKNKIFGLENKKNSAKKVHDDNGLRSLPMNVCAYCQWMLHLLPMNAAEHYE